MGLSRIRIEHIRHSAREAALTQWNALSDLRIEACDLEIRPLHDTGEKVDAIGVVAADAGLVDVELAPFCLQFINVADSRDRVHLAELFPLGNMSDDLIRLIADNAILLGFADDLGLDWAQMVKDWTQEGDDQRPFAGRVRIVADSIREMAEWGVCMLLARETGEAGCSGRLILHDGFLRTVLMRHPVVRKALPDWWRDEAGRRRGVSIAGVGKTSLLWQRLALVLDLDKRVDVHRECYVIIPREVEQQVTGRTGDGPRHGFGRLVLLKTRNHQAGNYLPVDIPEWMFDDLSSVDRVLNQIVAVSRTTFPRPGYPGPLGYAHENAHLTSFDAKVIRDQVIEALRANVPAEEFEMLLRTWAFQPERWSKVGRI